MSLTLNGFMLFYLKGWFNKMNRNSENNVRFLEFYWEEQIAIN